ncbi:hypothetical protein [Paenilisteria weihenstephanensis]|uniref:hypothetical protein n=1 Tax=Listeria weihenstephanensis TaxID=1006155 RepID=UPI0004AE486E|nr:hypothetical protein [Listeria weihenstephanensis]
MNVIKITLQGEKYYIKSLNAYLYIPHFLQQEWYLNKKTAYWISGTASFYANLAGILKYLSTSTTGIFILPAPKGINLESPLISTPEDWESANIIIKHRKQQVSFKELRKLLSQVKYIKPESFRLNYTLEPQKVFYDKYYYKDTTIKLDIDRVNNYLLLNGSSPVYTDLYNDMIFFLSNTDDSEYEESLPHSHLDLFLANAVNPDVGLTFSCFKK